MRIWHYDPDSGLLTGEGVADPDPMNEDEWLVPAFSTPDEPPAAEAGKARVYTDSGWTQVPDHRGETWYDGRTPVVIEALGDPAEEGLARTSSATVADLRAGAVAAVKAVARGLITETGLPWMVEREVSGGAVIPADVKAEAQRIRDASEIVETAIGQMNKSDLGEFDARAALLDALQ